MLCDRCIGPNTVAIHERDELNLRKRLWWLGPALLHQKSTRSDPAANLEAGQLALACRPSLPGRINFQPVTLDDHEPPGIEFF